MAVQAERDQSIAPAPPSNLTSEQVILGVLLSEPDFLGRILSEVPPAAFYRPANRLIFEAAQDLKAAGEPVDVHSLAAHLEAKGLAEKVASPGYLMQLATSGASSATLDYHCKLLKAAHRRRKLLAFGAAVQATAIDPELDDQEALAKVQSQLFELTREELRSGFVPLSEPVNDLADAIQRWQQIGRPAIGLSSGLPELDAVTGGFEPGWLVVVAGRPGMGKSAMACGVALNCALNEGHAAAMYSLEMSTEQLSERLLCSEAGVDRKRLRSGMLSDSELERLSEAMGRVGSAPIHIDASPDNNELTVLLKAQDLRLREPDLGLVVIDYLQLLDAYRKHRDQNETERLSVISRGLKRLALDLKVPVIAVSQLHRGPENRPGNRPTLADLRGSGSIEQDADVVLLLYREDYYRKEQSTKPGIVEIEIAKNRMGPTKTIEARWNDRYTRFSSLAPARPSLGSSLP